MVLVEVLQPVAIESRVGRELLFVEAVPDHPLEGLLLGEVGDPAGHQIQDDGVLRNALGVEGGQSRPKGLIEVVDEPRFGIEEDIIGTIPLASLGLLQHQNGHGSLIGACSLQLQSECCRHGRS